VRSCSSNFRQVELRNEVNAKGFRVRLGDLGENIATQNLDSLELPEGTLLRLGGSAVVKITGLRTPYIQIERFQKGLRREAKKPNDIEGRHKGAEIARDIRKTRR
jgi:MOSC domain-containing protein YiiM